MSTVDRVHEKIVHAKGYFVQDLETAVVKATKRNSKAPKWKHVLVLLNATWRRDIFISEIGKLLESRLRESSWSVVFKALIVAHILMDQGSNDRLIGYLATQPSILNLSSFRDSADTRLEQGKNIRAYAAYLEEKVHSYREAKRDFCRSSTVSSPTSVESYGSASSNVHLPTDMARSMRTCAVTDQMVAHLNVVVRQLQSLIKARFITEEIDNAVTLEAFKMLLKDMMRLFHVANEGVINILEHFTYLPKDLARSGLTLYKQFCTLTQSIDDFLDVARRLPKSYFNTQLPTLKHIPDISASLEQSLSEPSVATSPTIMSAIRPVSASNPVSPSSPGRGGNLLQIQTGTSPNVKPSSQSKQIPALLDFFDTIEENTNQQNAWNEQQQQQQQQQQQPNQLFGFDPFGATDTSYVQPQMTGGPTFATNPHSQTQPFDPFGSAFDQSAQTARSVQSQHAGVAQHPTGISSIGSPPSMTGQGYNTFSAIPSPQNFALQQQQPQLYASNPIGVAMHTTGAGYGSATIPVHQTNTTIAPLFPNHTGASNYGGFATQNIGMFNSANVGQPFFAPSQPAPFNTSSANTLGAIGASQLVGSNPFASQVPPLQNTMHMGSSQQQSANFDPFAPVTQRGGVFGAQNTFMGTGAIQPQQQTLAINHSNPFSTIAAPSVNDHPFTNGNYMAVPNSSSMVTRAGNNPFSALDPLQGAQTQPKAGVGAMFVSNNATGTNFQHPPGGEVLFS